MSQGLIPDPPKRVWDKDKDVEFIQTSRASLSGVYITTNLMTASSSAWTAVRVAGGPRDKLFVIAEIQPRSLFADEDDISSTAGQISDNEYTVGQTWLAWKTKTNVEQVERMKQAYITKMLELVKYKLKDMSPQLITRLTQQFHNLFYIAMTRQVSHLYNQDFNKARSYYPGAEHIEQPNPQQIENTYKNQMDQLTRTLKVIGQPHTRDEQTLFSFTARLDQPIRFDGTNRIIAIVQTHEGEKGGTKAKVVYGEVPEKFVADWNNSIGPWEKAIEEEI